MPDRHVDEMDVLIAARDCLNARDAHNGVSCDSHEFYRMIEQHNRFTETMEAYINRKVDDRVERAVQKALEERDRHASEAEQY